MPIKMYIYLLLLYLFCCKTADMINNLFHYLYINLYMFVLLMNIEIITVAVTSL